MPGKLVLTVAVLQSCLVTAAWAQSAAPASSGAPVEDDRLQEVTVTAQRREQSLQDVPIAVTAISVEELQNRSIFNTQDLITLAPELKTTNNVTGTTDLSPSLRGATQQDATIIVAESPFGVYVDDIYIPRMNGDNVEFPDIDSVELLRGPQGTLYGRNTEQGALKFTSRTPGKDSWLDVDGGIGNYDQYRGDFSVGSPIGDSGWAASVSGNYSYKNGEWFNLATDSKWGLDESYGARAKLHYYGSDVFDFQLFSTYVRAHNDGTPLVAGTTPSDPTGTHQFTSNQVVPTFGYYTVDVAPHDYGILGLSPLPSSEVDETISGMKFSWKLGSLTLRSISGYVTQNSTFTGDFGGGDATVTYNPPASNELGGSILKDREFTQEFQALGKALDDRLDYLAGAYYLHEGGDQFLPWYGFGFGQVALGTINISTKSYSFFGQSTYKITDAFSATAGVRWTEDKKVDYLTIQQLSGAILLNEILGGHAFPFTAPIDLNQTFVAITPKFALDYKLPSFGPVDSALVYLSAAKGFKSGGVNGINVFDLGDAQKPYGPEDNWTYEAGLKSEFFDHRLRVNADYFISKTTNLVLTQTVPVAGYFESTEQNAGDTKITGLEAEISAVPVQGLTLFLNPVFDSGKYTYLNPTSSAYVGTLPVSEGGYGVPARVPQTPWYTFSAGFDLRHPLALGSISEGEVLAGADWFKTASYQLAATDDYIQNGYDRLNGYVGYAVSKSLQFRLVGKNLQDRVTINTGSRSLGGYLTLPPREIMLTFAYRANAL